MRSASTPGTYSAEAYDSANFFLAGIASGAQDRDALNTYVSTESYTGITKTMKFDEKGEVSDVAIYAYRSRTARSSRSA